MVQTIQDSIHYSTGCARNNFPHWHNHNVLGSKLLEGCGVSTSQYQDSVKLDNSITESKRIWKEAAMAQ